MTARGGVNRDSVRRRNLGIVLSHVHRSGSISRTALTSVTGLNRSTVAALVADLGRRGLVEEIGFVGRGTPGRPSPLVRPRSFGALVLVADVEVATISFAVSGLGGEVHSRVLLDRAADRRTPEATVEDLVQLIDDARAQYADRAPIVGVGISMPGLVRGDDGVVHSAPNLDWQDVPLSDMLRARIGEDIPITMGNDADLGAMAEHIRGAGVGVDDLIYIAGEVGVGGGIIVGGHSLVGAAGYAGEVGHIVVNRDGIACRCGGRGCLETEAGEWALLRHMGRSSGNEREAVEAILGEAAAGEAHALEALQTVGTWLGIGLASLVNVFNPRCVILGGVFARAFSYVADPVLQQLEIHAQRPHRSMVTVVPASLGGDSTLLGAVELAFEPLLDDPTILPEAADAS